MTAKTERSDVELGYFAYMRSRLQRCSWAALSEKDRAFWVQVGRREAGMSSAFDGPVLPDSYGREAFIAAGQGDAKAYAALPFLDQIYWRARAKVEAKMGRSPAQALCWESARRALVVRGAR